MKVSVYLADQNPHRDRTLGITNMTDGLLNELMQYDDIELKTLVSSSSYQVKADPKINQVVPWRTDRMIGRLLTDNFHTCMWHPTTDLWFYPKGYLPLVFKRSGPTVGIVCDTILQWYYDHYRNYRTPVDYFYWLNLLKRSIASFDLILTISESAKTQILELCERFSINPPSIEVTYLSVRYENDHDTFKKEDYVIHVASRAPHKKTAWLIENWIASIKAGRDLPLLKVVGSLPESVVALVQETTAIEKLPFLDDVAYKAALAKARAFIMPSEVEGFGLPAVEAYCLGTPACYVKGTAVDEVVAIPEQLGAFDLKDVNSLFCALDEISTVSPNFIESQRIRLQQTYTAKAFGEKVIRNFRNLLG